MSRMYQMNVEIECTEEQAEKIIPVLKEYWPFEDPYPSNYLSGLLYMTGDGSLYGGDTEEEFTDSLARAVWKEVGYVPVEVNARCMEYLPSDTHHRSKDEYEKWVATRTLQEAEEINGEDLEAAGEFYDSLQKGEE